MCKNTRKEAQKRKKKKRSTLITRLVRKTLQIKRSSQPLIPLFSSPPLLNHFPPPLLLPPSLSLHPIRRQRLHLALADLLPISTKRRAVTLGVTLHHRALDLGRGVFEELFEKRVGAVALVVIVVALAAGDVVPVLWAVFGRGWVGWAFSGRGRWGGESGGVGGGWFCCC